MIRPKPIPYQRKANQQSNKAKMSKSATILELPMGTVLLDNQVAGHTFEEGKDSIGRIVLFFFFNKIKCPTKNYKYLQECLKILMMVR